TRKARHGNVAKAVECEVRFVHLTRLPAEGISIRLRGGAQVGGVEVAALVEYFAEPHGDRRSCWADDGETRPASEILAEVEEHLARRCAADRDGAQLAHAPDRRRQGCYERRRRRIHQGDGCPAVIVEGRARPAAELAARIIRLVLQPAAV